MPKIIGKLGGTIQLKSNNPRDAKLITKIKKIAKQDGEPSTAHAARKLLELAIDIRTGKPQKESA